MQDSLEVGAEEELHLSPLGVHATSPTRKESTRSTKISHYLRGGGRVIDPLLRDVAHVCEELPTPVAQELHQGV